MKLKTKEKNERLGTLLASMKKVIVAFSGGVDSTLVLKRAQEELGDQVLAVVVNSELFRESEFTGAVQLAKELGVAVYETEINELADPKIAANTPESWYYSKKKLYKHLNELAEKLGYDAVLDGMIMDDLADFRPGLRARTEAGVRSVLQEAELYKTEVRELAQHLKLPVWDKPASCSLASRVPYGIELDKRKIDQIDQAEQFIIKLGFDPVRVRHHGDLARIEVESSKIEALMAYKEQIQHKLQALGFSYVSIDLVGYRTGSMNEVLSEEIQEAIS